MRSGVGARAAYAARRALCLVLSVGQLAAWADVGWTQAPMRCPFDVRTGHRVEGVEMVAPPGTANCESRCLTEAQCVAYNLSRSGICELLSVVSGVASASGWRAGLRRCPGDVQPAGLVPPR